MSAHTFHIHAHGLHPPVWMVALFVVLIVLAVVLVVALGHPIVPAPLHVPHPLPGPMA